MSKRGSPWGGSLEQRSAQMREASRRSEPDRGDRPTASGDRSGQRGHPFPKHVWVNVTGRSDDRHPGVLMGWRQDRGEWEALVVWVEGGGMRGAHAHTAWLRAEHVCPA